ncbi:MAG TPA: hypothetical protein VKQ73_13440 [Stellaceae bacterium]|nr:hypothetical protein [Stellaceae bacterium]
MYSSLACAIDEITPIHMSELPYERLTEDMANAGRADFWCHHCNCHYVIELKRQPIGLSAKKSTNVRNRWDALQRQLDEVKDDFHKSVPDKANAVRLGILVIPARSFKQDEIDWSIEESERLSKVIQEECGKSLTFMSIIKVPPRWWRYKRLTRWEYNPVIVVAGTYRGREHRLN